MIISNAMNKATNQHVCLFITPGVGLAHLSKKEFKRLFSPPSKGKQKTNKQTSCKGKCYDRQLQQELST